MGIDDIILTADLRSKLYANALVDLNNTVKDQMVKIEFKGRNKKNILIAVDVPGSLKKADKDLLENLVKACKLTTDDVAFINISGQDSPFSLIISQLNIQKAILFGIPLLSIDFELENTEEKILTYHHCSLIRTIPLSGLQTNIRKKKLLWQALRQLFDL